MILIQSPTKTIATALSEIFFSNWRLIDMNDFLRFLQHCVLSLMFCNHQVALFSSLSWNKQHKHLLHSANYKPWHAITLQKEHHHNFQHSLHQWWDQWKKAHLTQSFNLNFDWLIMLVQHGEELAIEKTAISMFQSIPWEWHVFGKSCEIAKQKWTAFWLVYFTLSISFHSPWITNYLLCFPR